MSWYTTGAVSLTNGSNTVIGVSTKWTNPLIGVCAGQMLILKTANAIEIYEIASVQSDTQLTLANQYSGATKTGVSYEIPTAPNVSIEALALRISEMLNYYQQQMDGWQSILTGTGDITLTSPDGRVVTIKSQRALTEAINNTIQSQNELTNTINDAVNSQNKLTEKVNNSIEKQNALSNTVNNTIKKTGETSQSISGSLNADELTEKGKRVYSPNNKPTSDDVGALAVTKTVVNNVPTYKVGNLVDFSIKPNIAGIEPIYIIESYQNNESWYNVYSNGFIEQTSVINVTTGVVNSICSTLVNLLIPMKTTNYSVAFSRINWGGWNNIDFAQGERKNANFLIESFASYTDTTAVRWTVRGY